MKQSKAYIFGAWLLLVFFTSGQVILFAHQHKADKSQLAHRHHPNHQTVTEKCQLCDALHFNTMMTHEHTLVVHLLAVSHYDYKAVTYTFVSLSLVLSPGRAPPVS